MSKQIFVFGSGALGCLYGGKLSEADCSVSFYIRSHYDLIQQQGIFVESSWGDFHVKQNFYSDVSQFSSIPDYVIVASKVLPEINLVDQIRPLIGDHTTMVLLQNGLFIELELLKAFPGNDIVSAIAFVCAERVEPNRVLHMDYGSLILGRFPFGSSPQVDWLNHTFNEVGVDCSISTEIQTERWKKLIWNAAFNPISVITKKNTNVILADIYSEKLVRQIMKEVILLAEMSDSHLDPGLIETMIENTRKMKPYKTSMLVDYEKGRPLELEAILGNAVRYAQEVGVDVPCLSGLYGLLKLMN